MRLSCSLLLWSFLHVQLQAQTKPDADALFEAIRAKLTAIHDYTANVQMKIDVPQMKVPLLGGILYYKSPGKLKLERRGGLSFLPKNGVSLSVDQMMPTGAVTVIDAGTESIGTVETRILKVIPEGESSIILAKIWLDEKRLLAMRTETTTREQGTLLADFNYGKYMAQGLPDRVVFVMDVKEYKLPKGLTMDYDEGKTSPKPRAAGPSKGRIEIRYLSYKINTGLGDEVFR